MSCEEQQHGCLVEHKLVVKSWNASQQYAALRERAQPHRLGRKGDKNAADARIMDWLRGGHVDQREEGSGITKSEVLPYEESVVDKDDGRGDSEDEATEESCPRTVGQIKHAYRTRARKEETVKERRAVDAARKQKERLKQYEIQVKGVVKASSSRVPAPTQEASTQPALPSPTGATDHKEEDPDEFCLDASALVAHPAYRDSMLRVIRRHLSSGRNAMLSVRLSALDPQGEISSIKLALQQLCSESLLFCVRDQNVVASVHHQRGVVTLELFTRQPLSDMATLH